MINKIIDTPCGKIKGTDCKIENVVAFKGIRYATAGRFEYPKEVTSWEGIYEATKFNNACYQPRAFSDESKNPAKVFYYNEFRKGNSYSYSEDCLFLNIYVPEDATAESKLPVLFYIHGGAYTGGCGHEKHFDSPVWPLKGVIGVTINYRLGPLGFVCLPELVEEAGHTGNYALYDMVCALQWVKHNIEAFGGDAESVTIMGQSAGAMSVQTLCTASLSEKLFDKAVMSSGGGVFKFLSTSDTYTKRYEFWQAVMNDCGCHTLSEFREISVEQLLNSTDKIKKILKAGMICSPVIDDFILKESQLDAVRGGAQAEIPYLIGSNSQDIFPPVFYGLARKWCLIQDRQKKCPSYVYHFSRQLPGDEKGAWHSADLWYWFGTLKNSWRPMTEEDEVLSKAMVCYLTNFVKTGNPNQADLPIWQPMTKKNPAIMSLDKEIKLVDRMPLIPMIKVMLTNKPVGE